MTKEIRDKINAIRSQLSDLKRPKLGKYSYDINKIKELEQELQKLHDENSEY